MVKKLILLRHGEAANDTARDFDRSLTPTGERTIRHLAIWLEENEFKLDKIFTSTAKRALDTASILSEALSVILKKEDELYESSVRTFLQLVNETDEETECCIFVGHNPTITYLAEYLTAQPVNLEPGGAAIIELEDVNWSQVSEKTGDLAQYLSPSAYAS